MTLSFHAAISFSFSAFAHLIFWLIAILHFDWSGCPEALAQSGTGKLDADKEGEAK